MRTIRLNTPGVVYHVISRFVDRKWFFRRPDERSFYLHLLGAALAVSDWRCLAYALMSNHIHLAMVAGVMPLTSWAIPVHAPFARWMNQRYRRIGNLFARGPKDFAMSPDKEGALLAYIHNNPVRAKVVARAGESTWTSHRAYLDPSLRPPWLHADEGLRRAGFDKPREFDAWVTRTPGESGYVDTRELRRRARVRGALEVATPTEPSVPLVSRAFARLRPDPRVVLRAVANMVGLREDVIASHQRNDAVVSARASVVRICRALGLTYNDAAAVLGVSDVAAIKLARRTMTASDERACDLLCRWIAEQTEKRREELVVFRSS